MNSIAHWWSDERLEKWIEAAGMGAVLASGPERYSTHMHTHMQACRQHMQTNLSSKVGHKTTHKIILF